MKRAAPEASGLDLQQEHHKRAALKSTGESETGAGTATTATATPAAATPPPAPSAAPAGKGSARLAAARPTAEAAAAKGVAAAGPAAPVASPSSSTSGGSYATFDAAQHIATSRKDASEWMHRGLAAARRVRLRMDISKALAPKERDVFSLLLECASSKEHGGTGATVVRIAGGWVRDKLLGHSNHDIDVALNDLSGHAFAQVVNAHLRAKGVPTTSIGVIQANPDQSKHLETAAVHVMGLPLDMVNLRSETYAQDSRIPEIRFGTPEEDAYRRDFTINALFYNVNTAAVEDLTGRGLHDLACGIIRTPLPPAATFFDDPLRVLRAVRFAARFTFDLAPAVAEAAASDAIHEVLLSKVSRQRVGLELEGMFSGKRARPAVALTLLQQLRLLPVVFGIQGLQGHTDPPLPEGGVDWAPAIRAARWVSWLLARHSTSTSPRSTSSSPRRPGSRSPSGSPRRQLSGAAQKGEGGTGEGVIVPQPEAAGEDGLPTVGAAAIARASNRAFSQVQQRQHIAFMSSALLPLRRSEFVVPPKAGAAKGAPAQPRKATPLAPHIVKECLKLKSKDALDVHTVCCGIDAFHELSVATAAGTPLDRVQMGTAVRAAGPLWRACVDVACAEEVSNAGHDLMPGGKVEPQVLEVARRYDAVVAAVAAAGLSEAWTMKPLLDGKVLMSALQCPRGRMVGQLMEQQTLWQLANPEGTAEQCLEALRHWEPLVQAQQQGQGQQGKGQKEHKGR